MESQESQLQEFTNSEVRLSVNHKPGCKVELDVEAFPALVQTAHKKAVKQIAKEVSLPGFRKGKAPDALVLKNYPKDVNSHWHEVIANMAFNACEKLTKISLLTKDTKISFNMKQCSFDSGAKLTLTFETEPQVPSVDPSQLALNSIARPEVNDQKVDETIRQAQFFFANWKLITDRPIQNGDIVLLDVDVLEEDPPSRLFSNTRFEVSEKSMAKWMRDLVSGKTVGDSVEGMSSVDDDAKPEEKETFKPKKVRIHIREVQEATLPPLDDDFAQKLGNPHVADLRAAVLRILNEQADAHVREHQRDQVNEFLLTKYRFDLPPSTIEKETQYRMRQLAADPQFVSYWNSMNDQDRKATVNTIYEQSEKAVRMFYLCRKIVSDAKITITPEDLPPPPKTALEILMKPQSDPHSHANPEIRQAEAFSKLVMEKAEDYLIAQSRK